MALPRVVQGQLKDAMSITWYIGEGTDSPRDLSGATITGYIARENGSSVVRAAITGTLAADADQVNNKGLFTWTFSAADLANVGRNQKVQFYADYGDGLKAKTFAETLVVEDDISS